MKNSFSKRTNWELATNSLSKALQKRRDSQLPVLDLIKSNPTRCNFKYPIEEISKALTSPHIYSYHPHPKGLLSARQAIVQYYAKQKIKLNRHMHLISLCSRPIHRANPCKGHSPMNGTTTTSCHGACYLRGIKCICQKLNPDQIFLTSSTSEAYSFLFRLLTNPGDNVLIPCPSYPLFDFLGNLNDIELKPYKLAYENAWHIDFDSLSEAVTSKTRAILMVNPNNPTGSYIKEREIKKLVEFAKQNDLALISDEVFFDYDFENRTERMSFAQSSEVLTFTLNGLSKMAALPQMKLAWIVINGPESLVQEACQRLEVITDTYLSVNTPIQVALPEIFKHTKTIQIQIKKRLKTNLKTLQNTLQNFPTCECLKVEGGWYAILKIPKILTDEAWVLSLLEKESILIHPGHFYHFDQEGYLVLSLLPQTEIFTPAIEKILSYISEKS